MNSATTLTPHNTAGNRHFDALVSFIMKDVPVPVELSTAAQLAAWRQTFPAGTQKHAVVLACGTSYVPPPPTPAAIDPLEYEPIQ
jgi:hypothetical protein